MQIHVSGRRLMATVTAVAVLGGGVLAWAVQRGADEVPAAAAPLATTAAPRPTTSALGEPRQPFTPAPAPTARPSGTAAPGGAADSTPTPGRAPAASGLRLRIPQIGLDHRMDGEGVSANGTIDPEPGTIMWFKGFERVRPGSVGTAVIAGHVATGSRADVFADLAEVDVGDTVQVVDKGKVKTYRVSRAGPIDKQKVTTDQAVWGTNTSRSRLAIITCDDAFGFRGDGHRRANFVVIAERV